MYRLILVTDRRRNPTPLPEVVREAVAGGVDAVQLRERDLDSSALLALARELRAITREKQAALIINHRPDIAVACGADAVQLGWRSAGPSEVRKVVGEKIRIGVSCHNAEQVRMAEGDGADYIILGPIFPTPSKQGLVEAMGVEAFGQIVHKTKLPCVAIGGITAENCDEAFKAGAAGIAVVSAIMAAVDPAEAARKLRR